MFDAVQCIDTGFHEYRPDDDGISGKKRREKQTGSNDCQALAAAILTCLKCGGPGMDILERAPKI